MYTKSNLLFRELNAENDRDEGEQINGINSFCKAVKGEMLKERKLRS